MKSSVPQSSTMTSKGQVTIPASIRRTLGLQAGESISFKLAKDRQVIIEKNEWKRDLANLHKEVAAHLKKHSIKPPTDEQLDDAINESASQAAIDRYNRSLE